MTCLLVLSKLKGITYVELQLLIPYFKFNLLPAFKFLIKQSPLLPKTVLKQPHEDYYTLRRLHRQRTTPQREIY